MPIAGGAIELTLEPGRQLVMLDPSRWEIRTAQGRAAGADAGRSRRQAGRAVPQHADPQPTPRRHFRGQLERAQRHPARCRQPAGRPSGRARAGPRAVSRRGRRGPAPDLALGADRTRWDGMVLDYSILAPSQDLLGRRRLFGRARPQPAGRLAGGPDRQRRAAERRRRAGGRIVDRRLAAEPLRHPVPAGRRTLHRTAAEVGTRLLAVERSVPPVVVVRRHRLPGRAGAGVGDRGVPRRAADRARLRRRDGPLLDGPAGGVRRERRWTSSPTVPSARCAGSTRTTG